MRITGTFHFRCPGDSVTGDDHLRGDVPNFPPLATSQGVSDAGRSSSYFRPHRPLPCGAARLSHLETGSAAKQPLTLNPTSFPSPGRAWHGNCVPNATRPLPRVRREVSSRVQRSPGKRQGPGRVTEAACDPRHPARRGCGTGTRAANAQGDLRRVSLKSTRSWRVWQARPPRRGRPSRGPLAARSLPFPHFRTLRPSTSFFAHGHQIRSRPAPRVASEPQHLLRL